MKALKTTKAVIGGIIFLAVVGFILAGVVRYFVVGCNTETAPAITDAPWVIQTTTRIYYGAEFSLQDGIPSLKGYWTLDKNKYSYHSGIKQFPKELYGEFGKDVKLIKRVSQRTTI